MFFMGTFYVELCAESRQVVVPSRAGCAVRKSLVFSGLQEGIKRLPRSRVEKAREIASH